MTGDISLLSNLTDMPFSSVTFPNGQASHATKFGTLKLSKDYSLHDVLSVPDFDCTLISVSKLLKQTGCIAIFTDTLHVLQDHFSRTLIGRGSNVRGFTALRGSKSHGLMQHHRRNLLLRFCGIVVLDTHLIKCYLLYRF